MLYEFRKYNNATNLRAIYPWIAKTLFHGEAHRRASTRDEFARMYRELRKEVPFGRVASTISRERSEMDRFVCACSCGCSCTCGFTTVDTSTHVHAYPRTRYDSRIGIITNIALHLVAFPVRGASRMQLPLVIKPLLYVPLGSAVYVKQRCITIHDVCHVILLANTLSTASQRLG